MKPFDFIAWVSKHWTWSQQAFGPATEENDRRMGVVDHIRSELSEIEKAPGDIEEWADVVILATDGAMRAGATPEEWAAILEAKQEKNLSRDWPDWKGISPDKRIEHKKAGAS